MTVGEFNNRLQTLNSVTGKSCVAFSDTPHRVRHDHCLRGRTTRTQNRTSHQESRRARSVDLAQQFDDGHDETNPRCPHWELLRRHLRACQWREVLYIADHHFIVGLLTPVDGLARIWVGGIAGAVIEDGGDLYGAASGDEFGLGQIVLELPVEVIAGGVQERFRFTIGGGHFVFEGFTANVHVGHVAGEHHVGGNDLLFGDDMVRGTWRTASHFNQVYGRF